MSETSQHETSFSEKVLAFESELREIDDERECLIHAVNASRKLLSFRQALVYQRKNPRGKFILKSASSVAAIDRHSPQVRWFESIVESLRSDTDIRLDQQFSSPTHCDQSDEVADSYPFSDFFWLPFNSDDKTFGGLLLAREQKWTESERLLARRVAKVYSHALLAIKGKKHAFSRFQLTKRRVLIGAAVLSLAMFYPIHITAIAPVEVVPSNPYVVAAPFDSVVKEIVVERNQTVEPGTVLIKFEDIRLRNNFELASQSEAVAKARLLKVSQSAIHDIKAKHELAIVKAEHSLASAEKQYTSDLLKKSVIRAATSGVSIYTDKRDWVGKPVVAGEAILQIANPEDIEFEISLPVKDSLVLKENARIKVFLDSDPLNPIETNLAEASYQATQDKRGILSYRITARMDVDQDVIPRIGVQGSAQIFSDKAPLIYVLLRRPYSVFRQLTGW